MSTTATPDYAAITARQRQTWASGDFATIATLITLTADHLCDTADLRCGWNVLDIATGTGNAALSAARHGCRAVGLDFVPSLLRRGETRAAAEGLAVEFVEGDAQALPFADGTFDAVTSVFGAMFAPDHRTVAREMTRVVRPGGVIAMANWTPSGFIGDMFAIVGAHVPPPPGLVPGTAWSQESHLRDIFGDALATVWVTPATFTFRAPGPAEFVDFFRRWYGPMVKAFEAVGEDGAQALEADLVSLARSYDRLGDGATAIPATYAEVVLTLKG